MNPSQPTVLVAVYGTLLAGEANEHVPTEVFRRTPCTLRGTLWDTGYGYPNFVPDEKEQLVEAELLEVSERCFLRQLDRLEGYPRLYTRLRLRVALGDGSETVAWVYTMNRMPQQATPILGGRWRQR